MLVVVAAAAKKTLVASWTQTASFRGAASAGRRIIAKDCSCYDTSRAISSKTIPLLRRHYSHSTSPSSLTASYSHALHKSKQKPPRLALTPHSLPCIQQSFKKMSTSAAVLVEQAKKAAAIQAVDNHLLPTHRYVGIGSGSTVVYVVEAIVAKGPAFYQNMVFIPTGSQSKGLIRTAGLTLSNLDERPVVDGKLVQLDVCFDGADEVDDELNLIKGGGACLLQEKLVAVAARTFVAVADYRKQSPRLCTKWKTIPIEVLPMAAPDVLVRLQALGSPNPQVRSGLASKAGECVTDNGMWIIDAPFPPLLLPKDGAGNPAAGLWEVGALAQELVAIPGIVEIGLFHGVNGDQAVGTTLEGRAQKPVAAYFGTAEGTVDVQKAA